MIRKWLNTQKKRSLEWAYAFMTTVTALSFAAGAYILHFFGIISFSWVGLAFLAGLFLCLVIFPIMIRLGF